MDGTEDSRRLKNNGRFVVGSSRSLAALGLLASMCCAFACGSRAGVPYERFSPDAGHAGAGGSASQPFSDGAAGTGGVRGTAGQGATDASSCAPDKLAIQSVAPRNGEPSVSPAGLVGATFTCPLDRALARRENATLYGPSSGYITSGFPTPDAPNKLWLDPLPAAGRTAPYFPGEPVTAWLGTPLSGPYLWQFTAAVSSRSPGEFRSGAQDLSAVISAYDSVLADIDGDGDLDVVVRSDRGVVLMLNENRGSLGDQQVLPARGKPVLGDVDRDGDLDLSAGGTLLRNDGKGRFTDGQERASCARMGDFDGDGDLDCISQGASGSGGVLLNDGKGMFSSASSAPFGSDCEVADLDGDADLDVLCIAPVTEAGRVFLNDGAANFTLTDQVLGDAAPRAIAIGDIDADGDIDAVMAQWWGGIRSAPNPIWLNDGGGKFSAGGTLGDEATEIALGDLDGDGDLDAVVSHAGPYLSGPYHPSRLFLNDGAGRFTDSGRTLGDPTFHDFALGDLDSDGDLDAFVYHQIGSTSRTSYSAVWFNEHQ